MFNDDPDNFVIGKVRKFDVNFRKIPADLVRRIK